MEHRLTENWRNFWEPLHTPNSKDKSHSRNSSGSFFMRNVDLLKTIANCRPQRRAASQDSLSPQSDLALLRLECFFCRAGAIVNRLQLEWMQRLIWQYQKLL